VQASELPNLDEELILVLSLEGAKAYVLQTSSLRSEQQRAGRKQSDFMNARTGMRAAQAHVHAADVFQHAVPNGPLYAMCHCARRVRRHPASAYAHPASEQSTCSPAC
jgi:hypothetical protein